jgi:hypothetical protein
MENDLLLQLLRDNVRFFICFLSISGVQLWSACVIVHSSPCAAGG